MTGPVKEVRIEAPLRIEAPQCVVATDQTKKIRLATHYGHNFYLNPSRLGRPSINSIKPLLVKAQIVLVRNGKKINYSLPEYEEKLMRGFYRSMKSV